jgi:hypothetical protein
MEKPEHHTVVLFGEAERGEYHIPYYCKNLNELVEFLGNPPPQTWGLYYAVQALLFQRNLIFFRVREEGYSTQDYLWGLHLLEAKQVTTSLSAICLPGVGDRCIIKTIIPICQLYHCILITNQADLYDYLMDVA